VGRKALGGLLRNIPLVGGVAASRVEGEDPRYTCSLTPEQTEKAWSQTKDRFRECPTCQRIVCLSCWDEQNGVCAEDSPRSAEMMEAQAEQAGAMLKGFASALGLGQVAERAAQAAKQASAAAARCPNDGTLAPPGTKFCPECGTPMVQPVTNACPKCGKETGDAKFCPECGTKIEQKHPGVCPSCGTQTTSKFCPECGQKLA